ncbi:MAG: hypothetical protein KAZ26_24510 [Caldilineaceae bacterium]|nr:hypothetical protein [Caldilineaceae bacterium]
MTSRIAAITAYRPRIKLGRTAGTDKLVEFSARSAGLNESGVRQVLLELRNAVISFNRPGRAVKSEGLGIYIPVIDLDGVLKVSHRADAALRTGLNSPWMILNREVIGQTRDDLVSRWSEAHPEAPVG